MYICSSFCITSHPLKKVTHHRKYILGKYHLTGELFYCAWLPLRPSLKKGPHVNADPGDYEGRNPCCRSPTQQKWSGASPHPAPGDCPFQGPRPLRGLYPLTSTICGALHTRKTVSTLVCSGQQQCMIFLHANFNENAKSITKHIVCEHPMQSLCYL